MNVEWVSGLLGGVMIGAAAVLLLWTHGRIAGVSGVLSGVLLPQRGDFVWRLAFLLGLIAGGALLGRLWPERFLLPALPRWPLWIVSGLLVGVGTRLAGGCTSGHGVCGLGRGSPRSLVATLVFMGAAVVTVMITRHGL